LSISLSELETTQRRNLAYQRSEVGDQKGQVFGLNKLEEKNVSYYIASFWIFIARIQGSDDL